MLITTAGNLKTGNKFTPDNGDTWVTVTAVKLGSNPDKVHVVGQTTNGKTYAKTFERTCEVIVRI